MKVFMSFNILKLVHFSITMKVWKNWSKNDLMVNDLDKKESKKKIGTDGKYYRYEVKWMLLYTIVYRFCLQLELQQTFLNIFSNFIKSFF